MLSNLLGNDQAKDILRRLISSGRMPNSLLFAGEEGVGKKRFALQVAKAAACHSPKEMEACDNCPACLRAEVFEFPKSEKKEDYERVVFSEHPDIGMLPQRNRNILVGAVRQLEREANFRPYEAEKRFFLIDNAEKMNDEAANALLKTLEEPPETTFIILITSRPASLLPTIRSRCQVIRFAPLPASAIEEYLLESKRYGADDAALLASLSRGSIGRALSADLPKLLEQRDKMLRILEGIAQKNTAALLQIAAEIGDTKMKGEYEEHLDLLQALIHDTWSLHIGADKGRIANIDLLPQLQNLRAKLPRSPLADWLRLIEGLRENLAVNINRKIATDALFLKMANYN